jgi:ATP-dependent helicase HrpA
MSSQLKSHINQLTKQLGQCLLADRYAIRKQLRRLAKSTTNNQGSQTIVAKLNKLARRVQQSRQIVEQRQANVPEPEFPSSLPICQHKEEILALLKKHQVVVLAGETGSGKSTQVPKLCLTSGRGVYGRIGHTQPRRLAARTVAQRIAEELSVPLGGAVGYQVRFSEQLSDASLIKVMTDGILLAEIESDPYLNQYDTLIIDEAHERSLTIDFLLGYLTRLLAKRPDLKLIIMSATIDPQRFASHFNQAPVLEVSGRTYEVEVYYRPIVSASKKDPVEQDRTQAIIDAVYEIEQLERQGRGYPLGDVLVFLSGEKAIREAAKALRQASFAHTEVLPLYARLTNREQNRIFQRHNGRRIVLATNVAETSLTIPGIYYVIDTGLARISRYSHRSKVQRLPIEPISQASADQRKGRCGRLAPGICIRLYDEQDLLNRPVFTEPEIQRTNLAAVILQMCYLKLGAVDQFPFLQPPDSRLIHDGFKLLWELGAIDADRQLTPQGKLLARLPVDPRLGRMLIAANRLGCITELLIITSALSIQDPRERPLEQRQRADQLHAQGANNRSDFLTLINLWQEFEQQRQELSQNQLRRYCERRFLSFNRLVEWRDLHWQLRLVCQQSGFKENQQAADYNAIHQAILTGLLSYVAVKAEQQDYLAAHQRKCFIFPGSGLFKKSPRWLMAAEIVVTSKPYARLAAQIEPDWIEHCANHLVKRHYVEPHWQRKSGHVVAYERVTLYGLTIVAKRPVDYSRIDPHLARETFISRALVEQDADIKLDFFQHNNKLIKQIIELEDKSRKPGILVEDQVIFQFFAERLPAQIVNVVGLNA